MRTVPHSAPNLKHNDCKPEKTEGNAFVTTGGDSTERSTERLDEAIAAKTASGAIFITAPVTFNITRAPWLMIAIIG